MATAAAAESDPAALLARAVASGRVHSAYLLAGPGPVPVEAALRFARALVCTGEGDRPCNACDDCRRSAGGEADAPIALDGRGAKGPLYRHVGDHPDLFWVERGADDTRVRIGQVRALQQALRLRSHRGGRRAAVIADAEWLNQEAQNALLRLLEEPPPDTSLMLVTTSPSGLLATVRSRCLRVRFPQAETDPLGADAPEAARELASRLEALAHMTAPDLLDWAEEFRGARAPAAERVETLLHVGSAWLRARVRRDATRAGADPRPDLDAFVVLSHCRKGLVQRNANPQMVAERALLALRRAAGR